MRAFAIARAGLAALGLMTASASPASGQGSAPPAPAAAPQVSTQLRLQIERVSPLSRYSGPAYVTAADPRFVLVGKVVWVQHADVVALGSRQAFAIHSPARLGLREGQRGGTLCLLLTRNIRGEVLHWDLGILPMDTGCHAG